MINLPFKLTFNLPAAQRYFEGEQVTGTRIKIENDKVFFSPLIGERTSDSVTFSKRTRGGFEVTIDGEFSATLYAILTKEASFTYPFFLMKKAGNNSACLMHYTELGAPPKFAPHMRVWLPRKMHTASKRNPTKNEIDDILGPFTSVIRSSKLIVDECTEARKIGRPNREVDEAKSVISAFENLAYEILPGLHSETNIQQIRGANNLLNDFLKSASAMSASLQSKAETLKSFATAMHGEVTETKPRYHTVEEYLATNTVQQFPLKRGRGRPRKVLDVPTTELVSKTPEIKEADGENFDDEINLADYHNAEMHNGAVVIESANQANRPVKFWKNRRAAVANHR